VRFVNSKHFQKGLCQKPSLLKGTGAEDGLWQKADLAAGNNILVVVAFYAESYHL
jgi:hypothetical protein